MRQRIQDFPYSKGVRMTLESLEQIARGATPGPYKIDKQFDTSQYLRSEYERRDIEEPGWRNIYSLQGPTFCSQNYYPAKHLPDMEYIATFHPGLILKMINEIKAARAMRDAMKPIVYDWHTDWIITNGGHIQCPTIPFDEARKETDGV